MERVWSYLVVAFLTLGGIAFSDFEIPEKLVMGGKQRLAIHSLPGSGRVVDVLGAEDAPIRWAGVFSGQQAPDRVRILEQMRRGGEHQIFAWEDWRYTVVIESFEAEIAGSCWIPYKIQLCIVDGIGSQQIDWLTSAGSPALAVGLLSVTALQTAIDAASVGLASSDVGQAIGAAGELAQLVTARAYGLTAS